jgi:hypothetical protein
LHQHREQQGQHGLRPNVDRDVLGGHQQGIPEQAVVDHLPVVVQAHKLRRPEQ